MLFRFLPPTPEESCACYFTEFGARTTCLTEGKAPMKKLITKGSLVLCTLLFCGTVGHGGKPGLLPGQAKFRGLTLEEWGVRSMEWQIATVLGGQDDLSDSINGVRFLPPGFGGGEFEFDVTLEAGTPFVHNGFFVFGELYDDGTQDDPTDPFIPIIFETTDVETILDGDVILEGTTSEFDDLLFGPVVLDDPIYYEFPEPRGPGLNAVAATFALGVGGVHPPLPVGEHTLENTIDSLFFGYTHITYHITVVPRSE